MMKTFRWLLFFLLAPIALRAQPKAALKRIYFNMYTDSIKTVLNYYVNVEGEYSNGRYLPLDTSAVLIIADRGTMSGNEWIAPERPDFEKVSFRVVARNNPNLHDEITIWLKRIKDPRDAAEYDEGALPSPGSERKGRRR